MPIDFDRARLRGNLYVRYGATLLNALNLPPPTRASTAKRYSAALVIR